MTTTYPITFVRAYETKTGRIGVVYALNGRSCATFIPASLLDADRDADVDVVIAWIAKSLGIPRQIAVVDPRVVRAREIAARLTSSDYGTTATMWSAGDNVRVYVKLGKRRQDIGYVVINADMSINDHTTHVDLSELLNA